MDGLPIRQRRFWGWLLLLGALFLTAARPWLLRTAGPHGISWNHLVLLADAALLIAFYKVAGGGDRRRRLKRRWP